MTSVEVEGNQQCGIGHSNTRKARHATRQDAESKREKRVYVMSGSVVDMRILLYMYAAVGFLFVCVLVISRFPSRCLLISLLPL